MVSTGDSKTGISTDATVEFFKVDFAAPLLDVYAF